MLWQLDHFISSATSALLYNVLVLAPMSTLRREIHCMLCAKFPSFCKLPSLVCCFFLWISSSLSGEHSTLIWRNSVAWCIFLLCKWAFSYWAKTRNRVAIYGDSVLNTNVIDTYFMPWNSKYRHWSRYCSAIHFATASSRFTQRSWFRTIWYVQMMNWHPSRPSDSNHSAQTSELHSQWILYYILGWICAVKSSAPVSNYSVVTFRLISKIFKANSRILLVCIRQVGSLQSGRAILYSIWIEVYTFQWCSIWCQKNCYTSEV